MDLQYHYECSFPELKGYCVCGQNVKWLGNHCENFPYQVRRYFDSIRDCKYTGIVFDKLEYSWGIRYYRNGLLHKEDGPAHENSNGYKAWYINDQYHRLDGPAIIWPSQFALGYDWYIHGRCIPVKSQKEFESWLKVMAFE